MRLVANIAVIAFFGLCLGHEGAYAQGNSTSILQDGIGNRVEIDQTGGAVSGEISVEQIGESQIATITDRGDGNLLDVAQTGVSQNTSIRLSGSANTGDVGQEGFGNIADIEVGGGLNTFTLLQSSPTLASVGNEVGLVQQGERNRATQTQFGSDNSMTLEQNGDDNVADMLQDGTANSMILVQAGNANNATLEQYGNASAPIEVTQIGGMSVTITHQGGQ